MLNHTDSEFTSYNHICAANNHIQTTLIAPGSAELAALSEQQIRAYMAARGISFEKKDLPISLRPLILPEEEVAETSARLGLVRQAMNRIISISRRDIRLGHDSPCVVSFQPTSNGLT